jgi:hypothetical protein
MIVSQKGKGAPLVHYEVAGHLIAGISVTNILVVAGVNRLIKAKMNNKQAVVPEKTASLESL